MASKGTHLLLEKWKAYSMNLWQCHFTFGHNQVGYTLTISLIFLSIFWVIF